MPSPRTRNQGSTSAPMAPRCHRSPAELQAEARWDRDMADEIPASSLSQAERNAVWRHLKEHHPERVAFLNDPSVQRLIRECGAAPTFPRALVREALASQKVTKP